jgi:hypothetical protein
VGSTAMTPLGCCSGQAPYTEVMTTQLRFACARAGLLLLGVRFLAYTSLAAGTNAGGGTLANILVGAAATVATIAVVRFCIALVAIYRDSSRHRAVDGLTPAEGASAPDQSWTSSRLLTKQDAYDRCGEIVFWTSVLSLALGRLPIMSLAITGVMLPYVELAVVVRLGRDLWSLRRRTRRATAGQGPLMTPQSTVGNESVAQTPSPLAEWLAAPSVRKGAIFGAILWVVAVLVGGPWLLVFLVFSLHENPIGTLLAIPATFLVAMLFGVIGATTFMPNRPAAGMAPNRLNRTLLVQLVAAAVFAYIVTGAADTTYSYLLAVVAIPAFVLGRVFTCRLRAPVLLASSLAISWLTTSAALLGIPSLDWLTGLGITATAIALNLAGLLLADRAAGNQPATTPPLEPPVS